MVKFDKVKMFTLFVVGINICLTTYSATRITYYKESDIVKVLPEGIVKDAVVGMSGESVHVVYKSNLSIKEITNNSYFDYGYVDIDIDFEYSVDYYLVESIISCCVAAINICIFITIMFDCYQTGWIIRNVVPFILIFMPFGYIAFNASGLNESKTTWHQTTTPLDSDPIGHAIVIVVKGACDYMMAIIGIIYSLFELFIRLLISKSLLPLVTGSLSVLSGIRLGITKIGSVDADNKNSAMWDKLGAIVAIAQVPVFLMIAGIIYQIATTWPVVAGAVFIVISKISLHRYKRLAKVADVAVIICFALYAVYCQMYFDTKFSVNLNIIYMAISFVRSYVVNYYLTLKAFTTAFNIEKRREREFELLENGV